VFNFKNWTLTGGVTPAKIGQEIPIPPNSTFTGSADLTAGTVTGDISVPPFQATVNLFGLIPVTMSLTFTESGHATGTIGPDPNTPGNLDLSVTSKANLGLTKISTLFGLISIPLDCSTSSPVVFQLKASVPALQLTTGATFTGTTTFPNLNCNGLLGIIEGPLLSALFSGPNNPYTFTIKPPS
jgi:hypothetical protein